MADDKMAASGRKDDNGTNTGSTYAISLGNEGQEQPPFPLNVQGRNAATTSGTSPSTLENIQRSMASMAKIMQTLIAQKGGHEDNGRQSPVTSWAIYEDLESSSEGCASSDKDDSLRNARSANVIGLVRLKSPVRLKMVITEMMLMNPLVSQKQNLSLEQR